MNVLYLLALKVISAAAFELLAETQFKKGNLQFTANTYREMANENPGKSFLVAPLSMSVGLGLLENGAGGKTAEELISAVSLPDTEKRIQQAFFTIGPDLNVKERAQYILSSTNKVYIKKEYTVTKDFKIIARHYVPADVENINFTKADAATDINKWVFNKTREKITDIIYKSDLHEHTKVVLVNAFYFHATWFKGFKVENTSDQPFYVTKTDVTKVPMMQQINSFNYCRNDKLKVTYLNMIYENCPIEIIFVLPDEIDGLSALEANMDKVLEVPEYYFVKVRVQIPKFRLEQRIDFIPILKRLGVKDAFSELANFTRLVNEDVQLHINQVIQKTFIVVEETGTTAGEPTVFVPKSKLRQFDPLATPIEFNANHPFIFILKSPNGILSIGRYAKPNSEV